MKILSTLILLASVSTGCTVTAESDQIDPTPLQGTVGGQPWAFQAGHTSFFLSEGEPDFFATLYPATFTACGLSEPTGSHLIVAIPKTVGDYDMGLSRNMTFVVGNNNLISFDGRIIVDEVTPTMVKGGLVASYDGSNEVNGRFEVTICPKD
jgi:hypothetical protein